MVNKDIDERVKQIYKLVQEKFAASKNDKSGFLDEIERILNNYKPALVIEL